MSTDPSNLVYVLAVLQQNKLIQLEETFFSSFFEFSIKLLDYNDKLPEYISNTLYAIRLMVQGGAITSLSEDAQQAVMSLLITFTARINTSDRPLQNIQRVLYTIGLMIEQGLIRTEHYQQIYETFKTLRRPIPNHLLQIMQQTDVTVVVRKRSVKHP